MKRSYFVPFLFLGGVLLVAGLYGIRAATMVPDLYSERNKLYSENIEQNNDRDTLLQMIRSYREETMSLQSKHMRLHALSTLFVGLVFVIWAFDRRAIYAQLQARKAEDRTVPLIKAKIWFKSIFFCGLLLLFALASLVYLRYVMPDWVNIARLRSDQKNSEHIRAFLEGNGIPVKYVNWGSGIGRKTIDLEGPEVKDISILSELPVVSLTLHNTKVTNLNPLRKCPLRHLSLEGSPVSDISPLAGTQIGFLDLRETNVSDLQPLAHMPSLRSVQLSRRQIMVNLKILRNLRITVQEVPSGPAFTTGGMGWRKEYEDANNVY
jgi:hypothetical protein